MASASGPAPPGRRPRAVAPGAVAEPPREPDGILGREAVPGVCVGQVGHGHQVLRRGGQNPRIRTQGRLGLRQNLVDREGIAGIGGSHVSPGLPPAAGEAAEVGPGLDHVAGDDRVVVAGAVLEVWSPERFRLGEAVTVRCPAGAARPLSRAAG